MTLIFGGNFGKMMLLTTIFFHMFFTGIAEKLSGHWSRSKAALFNHSFGMLLKWKCTVIIFGTQTTTLHLFKTKCKGTVGHTSFNELCCLHESCRSGRAIIVDIVDWDTSDSNLINSSLSST